eukprot:COSAG05_NODE_424_length_9929_cov_25.816378_2_plen_241_part_00
MYSASLVDNAATVCFLDFQLMTAPPIIINHPYCAGHLHARYEWQAAQLRDALVDQFPEITVLPKPIDPHAPRNREKTGAFEVQLCYRQAAPKGGLVKVLLFSKLKRKAFPRLDSLLEQLQKLQDEGCWKAFTPKVHFDEGLGEEEDDYAALELPEAAPGKQQQQQKQKHQHQQHQQQQQQHQHQQQHQQQHQHQHRPAASAHMPFAEPPPSVKPPPSTHAGAPLQRSSSEEEEVYSDDNE